MMNQYYLKDKKALIYDEVNVSLAGRMPVSYFVPRTSVPLWCYARQLSQETIFQAKSFGEDESRFFVFNPGTVVELYDMISYRDKWYQVTRVDTTDDYNTEVFVYAKDAATGDKPTPDKIRPYNWTPEDE